MIVEHNQLNMGRILIGRIIEFNDSIPVYGARSQAIWFLQCRTASTSHRKQQYLPKMIEIMVLSLFSLRYWAQH